MEEFLKVINSNPDIRKKRDEARQRIGVAMEQQMFDATVRAAMEKSESQFGAEAMEDFKKKMGITLDSAEEHIKTSIELLYNSSCTRILLVAGKLAVHRGNVNDLNSIATKVELQKDKYWGFSLGDRVKIKVTFEEFKAVQTATLGWNGRLRTIYGGIGIVKLLMSGYDNAVHLTFPHAGAECTLYAGVLENATEPDDYSTDHDDRASEMLISHWNIGDIVTVYPNPRVVLIAQQTIIPTEKRGQILAFAGKKAVVTFDGERVFEIKTAILFPSSDKTPIKKKTHSHKRGFQVGQKVMLTKNMKKLIDHQEEKGGWNNLMSKLKGKEATVLNVQVDGSLNVQCEHNRSWRVSDASVLEEGVVEPDDQEDLPFTTGDIVKVKIPPKIRSILESAGCPLTFIEYMRLVGEVGVIGEKYQPFVRFNNEKYSEFNSETLRAPTEKQKEKYLAVREKVENLTPGSLVYLDVGPPNFVEEVLRKAGKGKAIISALTKPSTLRGFLPNDKAVIEYDDGSMYTIKKKYLTVPERFYLENTEEALDMKASQQIIIAIQDAVLPKDEAKNKSKKAGPIKSVNMSSGNPQTIHFSIDPITGVTNEDVIGYLKQNRNWSIEVLCEGQFMIRGDFGKVKVEISFSGEELGAAAAVTEGTVSHTEKSTPDLQADPDPEPTNEELQRAETHYLRLYNRALGQDVYFPYIVHGMRRQPLPAQQPVTAQTIGNNNLQNFNDCNIGTVVMTNNP